MYGGTTMTWLHCADCGNNLFRVSLMGVAQCAKCGKRVDIPPRQRGPPEGPHPAPIAPPEPELPHHPDVKGPMWSAAGKEALGPGLRRKKL